MTKNEYIAELSANLTLVNYTMGIMAHSIDKREKVSTPQFDNEICTLLIKKVNELIEENSELKAKIKQNNDRK